jgi:signal transduction histidine kinase/CheY-like chemotaxis protein
VALARLDRYSRDRLGAVVFALGGYVFVGGVVSFLGWVIDRPLLTDWDGDGISIQPNAALAATSAGAALLLLQVGARRIAASLGAFVALIGGATLFQYLAGVDFGIDTLLMFERTWGRVGVIVPGRMGPPGSLSWTCVGTALLLAARPARRARRWAAGIAMAPTLISSLSLIGYLYGASVLYSIPTLTVIALQTATFIFCVSLGILLCLPEQGIVGALSRESPGGVLARRMLPFLLLIPIALGVLRLWGERTGLYDTAFGTAWRSIAEISLFLLLIWRTAVAIDRESEQRQRVEAERERLLALETAARSEAEQQATLKDEFLATLSHELRTPLSAVLGWCEIMRRDFGDPDKARNALDIIDRNARLQAQLIADLLDMSRILSGKMRLEVQRVDLPTAIDAAIESIRPAAEAKGVRLHRVVEPLVEGIHGDPSRIQQVIWNLLSNAVKFTPRGGHVQVTLARGDSQVEISVADTGEGIAPDFLPRVFDRFRQGDPTSARSHGGLGLGLAIVKQLTELHGGTVEASSRGLGMGSAFVVRLPLAFAPAAEERPRAQRRALDPQAAAFPPPALHGVRVLVVDDEPDALAMAERMVTDSGADVATATGTDQALSLLGEARFDVIVSDIGMPDRDGYELMKECRTRGITTPAIALTAFARTEDRTRAMLCGYQGHLTKPVEPAELLASIGALAGRAPPAARPASRDLTPPS